MNQRGLPIQPSIERFKTLRQSRLATFDRCALSAHFEEEYRNSWDSHPSARGSLFHRFAAKALRAMVEMGEKTIPTDLALEILHETLRQHDIDRECPTCLKPITSRTNGMIYCAEGHEHQSSMVNMPSDQVKDLRWIVVKWAHDNAFDIANLVSIEERLKTTIRCQTMEGDWYERILTGQLDAMFVTGAEDEEAIVLDWKDAQPLDAKILTPSGWTTMGELRVGDMVIGRSGEPTEVTGVHPKGERLVYEVEFTDGSRTRCCDHHWWTVRRSGGEWQTKRLREIMADKSRWHVPAVEPVRFDVNGDRPLNPYLLGALLGDGCFPLEGSVDFACADDELVDAVRAALPEGMSVKHQARYNWRLTADSRATRNPLRAALANLGLMGVGAAEKFVPEVYLFAPVDDRLALLRGLMDTDGSIDADGRISFCSASVRLAEQVQFLVRSLGGFATRKAWPRERHRDTHVVYFQLPQVPFRLGRKRERWHEPKHGMTRSIRSITPLGVELVQCIEVAAEDMLYVTDDLILTHNTWMLPAPTEVGFDGYFQQRFYAWLVFKTYPQIQRVTLREFYVRYSEPREATVWRTDIEDIEAELSAIAERFDRAFEEQNFPPSPGAHCGFCPRPGGCPIFAGVRGEGMITDEKMARRVAGEAIVIKAALDQRTKALRGWSTVHGAVEISDHKGKRVWGYQPATRTSRPKREQIEQAISINGAENLDLDELYETKQVTRFAPHIPREDEDPDPTADDAKLLSALEESVARMKTDGDV